MARVLSTDQAASAIQQIQSILNSEFEGTISKLDSQGKVLADPQVWDGPLAGQFRGEVWPAVSKSLQDTKLRLDDLRARLDRIHQDIMQAGGGA